MENKILIEMKCVGLQTRFFFSVMIYDMIFHYIADNATPRQKVHILTSKKREKGRFV